MPVEEELAAPRVPEAAPFGRVAEHRAGESVQRPPLRLEPLPADVDHQPLTAAGRAAVLRLADVRRQSGLDVGRQGEPG